MSVRDQYRATAEARVRDRSGRVTRRHYDVDASERGVFLGLLVIILSCVAILLECCLTACNGMPTPVPGAQSDVPSIARIAFCVRSMRMPP
jgi:hypothetical protein